MRRIDPITAAVAMVGLVATAAFAKLLLQTTAARDYEEFRAAAREARAAIIAKVETSVALLRATSGLFASDGRAVNVESFGAFVARLDLRDRDLSPRSVLIGE